MTLLNDGRPAGLKAPFPWFGGKSRCADLVWERLGDVPNYVEPFFGSGAVLLARPHAPRTETINDLDCYLANFWRAVKAAPAEVAAAADWPVNEADLHARHRWLVAQTEFRERMRSDPFYHDARIAGFWVWGISQWIGSGWCAQPDWEGRANAGAHARGIHAKMPTFKRALGSGILRTEIQSVRPRLPNIATNGTGGRGLLRKEFAGTPQQLPQLSGGGSGSGRGVLSRQIRENLTGYIEALADRLRRVRVCCGDWERILGPSPTTCIGVTGVFLDPPYSDKANRDRCYNADSFEVAHAVREWAIRNGHKPKLRIALCGYAGEHALPAGWTCVEWRANGGYGNQGNGRGRANAGRERIWFSPHCRRP